MRSTVLSADRLLRLYPRAWRERYETEMLALLEQSTLTPGVVLDVMRGAMREWVREMAREPTSVPQLKRERLRKAVIMLGAPIAVTGMTWLLAQPLRRTWLATSDSDWLALHALPQFGAMIRAIVVLARRTRITNRAIMSFQTPSPERLIALGIGRAEYWCWFACVIVSQTLLQSFSASTSIWNQANNAYTLGYALYFLFMTTKSELTRRAHVQVLINEEQRAKRNPARSIAGAS